MPSIKVPATKQTTTLSVIVKCRPLTKKEMQRNRNIVRVTNNKEVVVLDPDLSKDYLDRMQNRTKEKKYMFDYAFGPNSKNLDVYETSIASTIAGVIHGLNATVFAYGSTGSGKTYTMVGASDDPGLMVLSLNTIFDLIKQDKSSDDFEVNCSYLEVYNEVIYDLLEKSSGHLELREDPVQGIVVDGLRSNKGHSVDVVGRRRGFQLSALPMILGAFLSARTESLEGKLLGRYLVRIGMGVGPSVASLYVTEVSPSFVRGTYGSFIQIETCLGLMSSLLIGISAKKIAGWWRVCFWVSAIPAAILALAMEFCAESP